MAKEPAKSKLLPRINPVRVLDWEQSTEELVRIKKQFCIIHDLPKVDGISPSEYMWETLEGLRERCIALNWRRISLMQAVYKKRRVV